MDSPTTQWISAGASDVGCVRDLNEDAYLDRSDLGIWAVTDGMGGHSSGEVASRSLCDSLSSLPPTCDLASAVDFVDDVCSRVNSELVNLAAERGLGTVIGCTLVSLVSRGPHAVVVWAGDSRLYRFRGGQLQQLSEDHSYVNDNGQGDSPDAVEALGHVITRAVGADPELFLDLDVVSPRAGDRYLLCSDGLTNEVTDAGLARLLAEGSPATCTQQLVLEAVRNGGKDNVTALVMDCVDQNGARQVEGGPCQ